MAAMSIKTVQNTVREKMVQSIQLYCANTLHPLLKYRVFMTFWGNVALTVWWNQRIFTSISDQSEMHWPTHFPNPFPVGHFPFPIFSENHDARASKRVWYLYRYGTAVRIRSEPWIIRNRQENERTWDQEEQRSARISRKPPEPRPPSPMQCDAKTWRRHLSAFWHTKKSASSAFFGILTRKNRHLSA